MDRRAALMLMLSFAAASCASRGHPVYPEDIAPPGAARRVGQPIEAKRWAYWTTGRALRRRRPYSDRQRRRELWKLFLHGRLHHRRFSYPDPRRL